MKHKIIFCLFIALSSISTFAQKKSEVQIALLGNDKITDVNVDAKKFPQSIKEIIDFTEKEFGDVPSSQKIAVLSVAHKTGKPTVSIYSNPKMDAGREAKYLKAFNTLNLENTKLVDFPILYFMNSKFEELKSDFTSLVYPNEKINAEYKNADLKTKLELNKSYAINEVLPILSAYEAKAEAKFAGVQNFGNLVTKTNFSQNQDIESLTSKNQNFWRAEMEMESKNQIIPITKIFMLVSQGELDQAKMYLDIVGMFSDSKNYSDAYLEELSDRLNLFNEELVAEIQKGIVEHDKGKYEKAISIYKNTLEIYPGSAWANYELYFSQNSLDLKNKKVDLNDRANWDKAKVIIYKHNPLYNMDVRANNGKEGYLLFRRQQGLSELFKKKEEKLNDVYKYADIAMDLGVYDFAAQLFWYSATFNSDKQTEALYKSLYCMEKLGVTNLKTNFKGDFKKIFADIEKDKEKEMTSSDIYNSFKE